MESKRLKEISKSLSYVLRHRPDTVGIELEAGGWVSVEILIAAYRREGGVLNAVAAHGHIVGAKYVDGVAVLPRSAG